MIPVCPCRAAAGRAAVGALATAGLLLAAPPSAAASRAAAGHGAGPPGASADTAACELRLEPVEVPVRDAAVLVSARADSDPGGLREVVFPRESGVQVLNAAPAPDHDEVVARMALDTSGASPGRWSVVIRGEERTCRGTLRIRAREGDG